jgi:hypothetical protein
LLGKARQAWPTRDSQHAIATPCKRTQGRTLPGAAITLQPSRLKWWLVAITCACMSTISAWLATSIHFHTARVKGDPQEAVTALLFCAALFALGTLVSLAAMRRGCLRLSADCFEVTDLYQRTKVYHWDQVNDFGIYSGRMTKWVRFQAPKPSFLDRINASLSGGRNTGLPDTYGLSASEFGAHSVNLTASISERTHKAKVFSLAHVRLWPILLKKAAVATQRDQ